LERELTLGEKRMRRLLEIDGNDGLEEAEEELAAVMLVDAVEEELMRGVDEADIVEEGLVDPEELLDGVGQGLDRSPYSTFVASLLDGNSFYCSIT